MQRRLPKVGGALGSFMKSALSKPKPGSKRKPKFGLNKPIFFADIKNPAPLPFKRPLPLLPGSQAMSHPTLLNSGLLPVKVVQFYAPTTTTTTPAPLPQPPPATSVLGKAAYSGFFGNGAGLVRPLSNNLNSFNFNSFPAPPQLPYPTNNYLHSVRPPPNYRPMSISSLFKSHPYPSYRPNLPPPYQPTPIYTDPVPAASERYQSMAPVPSIPPVIRIGSHPPPGYVMTHGEQQLITLKLPDVKMGKKLDSADLLRGARYQSGAGSSRRRSDTYTEDKNLPDIGAIYTVNMVLQTPNISAPVNGSQSPHFHKGMEEMGRLYGGYGGQFAAAKSSQSPLDVQVKLLGKLFTDLQRLQPGKARVPDEGQGHGPLPSYTDIHTTSSSDPFGSSKPIRTYYTPKVDAPLLAVHIQSYSLPEPGSSDPDVLDSARIFGLQGHKFEFGATNEIINLMDTAGRTVNNRVPLEELGYSRGEVSHNLEEWIKSYVSLTRRMKDQAHAKGEGIANSAFRQHQVQLRMGDGRMEAMDPKMFSQGASITNAGAVATYKG